MPRYFAMVKLKPHSTPQSAGTYEADDVNEAVKIMVARAGVSSSIHLDSFELLEVRGKNYIPIASKGLDYGRIRELPDPDKLPEMNTAFTPVRMFKVSTL